MAMEPINIFSHRVDPRGVAALLRSLCPAVEVTRPYDAWEVAAPVGRAGGVAQADAGPALAAALLHPPPPGDDFRAFARDSRFGPLDIGPFRLIEGDLALAHHWLIDAPGDVFRSALSSARGRHRATNWLAGGGVPSRTDPPT